MTRVNLRAHCSLDHHTAQHHSYSRHTHIVRNSLLVQVTGFVATPGMGDLAHVDASLCHVCPLAGVLLCVADAVLVVKAHPYRGAVSPQLSICRVWEGLAFQRELHHKVAPKSPMAALQGFLGTDGASVCHLAANLFLACPQHSCQ
jgi:hypothetical protein